MRNGVQQKYNQSSAYAQKRVSSTTSSGSTKSRCQRPMDRFASFLNDRKCKDIIIMAGAGISTASGIPDFRSPGTGLYYNTSKYNVKNPTDVFDLKHFNNNPHPFLDIIRDFINSDKQPNIIHSFCKMLQTRGLLLRMYTQNIDGLEKKCGISTSKLVEAHGTLDSASCCKCFAAHSSTWTQKMIRENKIPSCRRKGCSGFVKPDVVMFGEELPKKFYLYPKDFQKCDLLIVMGTSLNVEPFSELVNAVSKTVPRVLLNRDAVGPFLDSNRKNDIFIKGDISKSISDLLRIVGWSNNGSCSVSDDSTSSDGSEVETWAASRIPPPQAPATRMTKINNHHVESMSLPNSVVRKTSQHQITNRVSKLSVSEVRSLSAPLPKTHLSQSSEETIKTECSSKSNSSTKTQASIKAETSIKTDISAKSDSSVKTDSSVETEISVESEESKEKVYVARERKGELLLNKSLGTPVKKQTSVTPSVTIETPIVNTSHNPVTTPKQVTAPKQMTIPKQVKTNGLHTGRAEQIGGESQQNGSTRDAMNESGSQQNETDEEPDSTVDPTLDNEPMTIPPPHAPGEDSTTPRTLTSSQSTILAIESEEENVRSSKERRADPSSIHENGAHHELSPAQISRNIYPPNARPFIKSNENIKHNENGDVVATISLSHAADRNKNTRTSLKNPFEVRYHLPGKGHRVAFKLEEGERKRSEQPREMNGVSDNEQSYLYMNVLSDFSDVTLQELSKNKSAKSQTDVQDRKTMLPKPLYSPKKYLQLKNDAQTRTRKQKSEGGQGVGRGGKAISRKKVSNNHIPKPPNMGKPRIPPSLPKSVSPLENRRSYSNLFSPETSDVLRRELNDFISSRGGAGSSDQGRSVKSRQLSKIRNTADNRSVSPFTAYYASRKAVLEDLERKENSASPNSPWKLAKGEERSRTRTHKKKRSSKKHVILQSKSCGSSGVNKFEKGGKSEKSDYKWR